MNYRAFLFLLSVIPFTVTLGQSTSLDNFIDCIELQNGPDNLLINGRPYLPNHLKAEGNPYFQTDEWRPGTVYINGNSFATNYLKYNLTSHQLIIKHERPNGTNLQVVLSDLLVDSFYIEEYSFVNQRLILPAEENSGYLEKLFEEDLSFFRRQKKVFVTPTNSKPYGRFSNLKDVFYLIDEEQPHRITQKNEFLACFPDHKSQINNFMKIHSLKWKKMTNIQFTKLLKFCHDQI